MKYLILMVLLLLTSCRAPGPDLTDLKSAQEELRGLDTKHGCLLGVMTTWQVLLANGQDIPQPLRVRLADYCQQLEASNSK